MKWPGIICIRESFYSRDSCDDNLCRASGPLAYLCDPHLPVSAGLSWPIVPSQGGFRREFRVTRNERIAAMNTALIIFVAIGTAFIVLDTGRWWFR